MKHSTKIGGLTGIYKKAGRRYVEIGEYDPEFLDHIPNGVTMTVKRPGSTYRRFNIDPALAPMLAAGIYCEDQIAQAIVRAGELRPVRKEISLEQRAAYDKFLDTMPEEERFYLTYGSARDVAEAGTRALTDEVQKLLTNESIRAAYDHFMLLCKLSQEHNIEIV
jgi:hypothetical protein